MYMLRTMYYSVKDNEVYTKQGQPRGPSKTVDRNTFWFLDPMLYNRANRH